MEQYLANNPFFIEKKEKNQEIKYVFQKNEHEKYSLFFRKNIVSPIRWIDHYGEVRNLFETPKWFQKLYIKTHEFHVEKNRVRLKVNDQRLQKFQSILCCCLLEENGYEIYCRILGFPQPDIYLSIEEKYRSSLEKIAHRIKKFDYEVVFLEEAGQKINFIIK